MPLHFVNEAVNLGIHAMLVLAANPDRRLSSTEISRILKVSASHLAKVMQKLAKKGLVFSSRGTQGGFILAKSPEEIIISSIVDAIDPDFRFDSCLLKLPRCQIGKCPISDLHQKTHDLIRQHFEKLALSDFEDNFEDFFMGQKGLTNRP